MGRIRRLLAFIRRITPIDGVIRSASDDTISTRGLEIPNKSANVTAFRTCRFPVVFLYASGGRPAVRACPCSALLAVGAMGTTLLPTPGVNHPWSP